MRRLHRPALVVASSALALAACAPTQPPATTGVLPGAAVAPQTAPTKTATVIVDGWSVAAMGTTDLTVDGEAVKLEPLAEEHLRELSPGTLELLASRLHSVRRNWNCGPDGCAAGNVTMTLSQLAEPKFIPLLGETYAAAAIDHGVYAATVEPSTTPFNIAAGEFSSAPEAFPALEAGAELVVAAGLGVIFPFQPYWAETTDSYFYYDLRYGQPVADIPSAEILDAVKLGLANTSGGEYLRGLHPSQLSLWTSLTAGCGSEVNCVIDSPETQTETILSETLELCYEGSSLGTALVYQHLDDVTFPYPTHQLGAWGDAAVDPLALTVEEIDARLAAPHLTEATQLLRAGLHLWQLETTGDGLAPALRLVAPLAYVRELGPDETAEPVSAEEIITQLLPDYVSVCDTSNA